MLLWLLGVLLGLLDVPDVEDGVLLVEEGLDMSLPLVDPPLAADEPPFTMASNSARLSCPSWFLSALSKSMCDEPALLALLPPDEADPELAEPEVALGDFAWLSVLFLLASAAYADAVPSATRDRPRTKALNFMGRLLCSG
ncbi:MAG TPA: hypothetical protein VJT77_12465 [Burkholderiales bacterium]|nr:hypothetical protein [Burkholderiales bacterium]